MNRGVFHREGCGCPRCPAVHIILPQCLPDSGLSWTASPRGITSINVCGEDQTFTVKTLVYVLIEGLRKTPLLLSEPLDFSYSFKLTQ